MIDQTIVDRATLDAGERRIGRYTVVGELAEGGMAKLFVVRRDGDPEVRALKRIHDRYREHEVVNRRFHREAWLSSLLEHPHIVRTFDAGFEDGVFCLVTELIAGESVARLLEEVRRAGHEGLPVPVALAIAAGILDGLAYAHELRGPDGALFGVVHRDVTPRNVLVGYAGEVKLIDFGVARGNVGEFRTAPGVIVGSLEYLSPEQAMGEQVDRRSDIYSAGALLYEMLTGRPLVGPSDNLTELLSAIVRDLPLPPSVLAPNVPVGLDPVLLRALSKSPDERFPTALAMRNALLDAAAGAGIGPASRPAVGHYLARMFPDGEQRFRGWRETSAQDLPSEGDVGMPTRSYERPRSSEHTKLGAVVLEMPGEPVMTATGLVPRQVRRLRVLLAAVSAVAVLLVGAVVYNVIAAPRREPEPPAAPLAGVTARGVPALPAQRRVPEARGREASPDPSPGGPAGWPGGPGPREARGREASPDPSPGGPAGWPGGPGPREARGREPSPDPSPGGPAGWPGGPGPREARGREASPDPSPGAPGPREGRAPRRSPVLDARPPPVEEPSPKQSETAAVADPVRPEPRIVAPYPELRRLLDQLKTGASRDNRSYVRLWEGISSAAGTLPAGPRRAIESELASAELTYDVDGLARALALLIRAQSER